MADNFTFQDASGVTQTGASQENGGVHTPATILYDAAGNPLVGQKTAAESIPVTFPSDASATEINGDVAHDAADSGNPVKVGGKAATSTPAAVSNGDRVNAYFDEYGRLVVKAVPVDSSGTEQGTSTAPIRVMQVRADITGAQDKALFSSTSVPGTTDITVSDSSITISAAVTPTTAFFTGANITTNPRHVFIPMAGFRSCTIFSQNLLTSGGSVTLINDLYGIVQNGGTNHYILLDTKTANDGLSSMIAFCPAAQGTNGDGNTNWRNVPALGCGSLNYIRLTLTSSTNAPGGHVNICVLRQA